MAQPRDIVVYIDEHATEEPLLWAAGRAEHWRAHLIGVFVAPGLGSSIPDMFAVGEKAIRSMLTHHAERVQTVEAHARGVFEMIANRNGLGVEWRLCTDVTPERVMLHARHADLSVLGSSIKRTREFEIILLSEDVVLASGRPSVLIPETWAKFDNVNRIVVGWNGSREA